MWQSTLPHNFFFQPYLSMFLNLTCLDEHVILIFFPFFFILPFDFFYNMLATHSYKIF